MQKIIFFNKELDVQKISRICFVLIALIMFYFSSQPGDESNELSDSFAELIRIESDGSGMLISVQPLVLGLNLRKMAHIGIFGTLGMLAFLSQDERRPSTLRALFAIIVSYSYACVDEIHQSFVSGRAGMFADTIIDLIGILLGVFFILIVNKVLIVKFQKRIAYNL